MPRVVGTKKADTIVATNTTKELIYGAKGDDLFVFRFGDYSDRFYGEAGDDMLAGPTGEFRGDESYKTFNGVYFNGGTGYDTVALGVQVIETNVVINLNKFSGQYRSVEAFAINVLIDTEHNTKSKLKILGTRGDETLDISSNSHQATALTIRTKGGDDRVILSIEEFAKSIRLDTGGGNDFVDTGASVDGARITTGAGNDTILVRGLARESYDAGLGDDLVHVHAAEFGVGLSEISLGGGRDTVVGHLGPTGGLARITDFDPLEDLFRFDGSVVNMLFFADAKSPFNKGPNLVVDVDEGEIYYNGALVIDLGGPVALTAANFILGDIDSLI